MECLGAESKLSTQQIIWIEHCGEFYYYDALEQETFIRMALRWNGHRFENVLTETPLEEEDVLALLEAPLQSVFQVLRDLE